MACTSYYPNLSLRPRDVKVPGCTNRADIVQGPLNGDGGNVPDLVYPLQQRCVFQKGVVIA
eukprot:7251742-Pyramimonas_sp.AAC.1